ncbi:AraC family transcriptional regulator [Oceanirhabdus seepicola]|uniref:AraC family transcriptional regulator n=1 Tax=Oceanirhabdus seepicola TaxID=2828781 RepID=A0A9J6NX71_9CLOT|nr:GyrI-like domain-containing protein [Oceanirhabdus seepicola]MCM1988859.1 AraC family transcriptional regulator [Oceanirhabdus seepicola]
MTNSQSKKEYLRRIYKVQDYIETHLYDSLNLQELAVVAGFSKFHFHRIFKGIVQEPLSQYVNRLKLERAVFLLIHRPDMTVTDIAYHFGFADSAVFSRTFKNHYKVSPNHYRNQYSKNRKDPYKLSQYNEGVSKIEGKSKGELVQGNVEILMVDNINVAYLRHIGTYKDLAITFSEVLEKLFKYAKDQNLTIFEKTKVLTVYHDNPEFAKEDQLRTSLCMTIADNVVVEENSDIGSMMIPSGKYAVGHFDIFQKEYSGAWDFMYSEWLSNSGYQPRDSFAFEVYNNDPNTHPQNKHLVDIYLPIEPL